MIIGCDTEYLADRTNSDKEYLANRMNSGIEGYHFALVYNDRSINDQIIHLNQLNDKLMVTDGQLDKGDHEYMIFKITVN